MTIIDELLILLDDLDETPLEAIPTYFAKPNTQVLFSSLGRLVNRGWVIKKTKRQEATYAISIHGVNELNRTLDAVKKEDQPDWDRKWRLVIFDIPETKRKMRDQFREALRDLGFGMLKSSIWISPWDKKEEVKRIAKRCGVSDQVIQLETAVIDAYQNIQLIQQSWDWKYLEKEYQHFIALAEKGLDSLKKADHTRRFEAKKMVFCYAELLKKDPVLPAEIAPNAVLARKARELYIKIRPFCLADPIVE